MPLIASTTTPYRRFPLPLGYLVLALLVGSTAWLTLMLARVPGSVAAVWISSGILVGWLLSHPTRSWGGYLATGLLAELVARQLAGGSLLEVFGLGTANLIEVLIVAGSVRRRVPDVGDPQRWLTLGYIAAGSTLVASAVSATLGAAVITATSHTSFLSNFTIWYTAHVVGMVLFATFTLVAHREGLGLIDVRRRLGFFGWILVLAVVGGAVFIQSHYPLLFLAFPPLLWGAFRYRFAGVAVGVLLLAVIGGVATTLGHGPLGLMRDASPVERILLLEAFIATACLMTLPVALSMAERARLATRMRESELRYRMLADYSQDLVVRVRPDGKRLYVSPSAREIMGWDAEELLNLELNVVHPEDRAARQQIFDDVVSSGQPATAVYRVLHKDGHYIWVESAARLIPSDTPGGGMDIIFAARDISRRVRAEQALQESLRELDTLARVDTLTGLPNRRQFDERLDLAVTRSQRQGVPVALMFLDIDHFKQINDSMGHSAGDEVLRVFAARLAGCVRAGDLVARLGGDEFVILVEDAAIPEAVEVIARKLIAAMDGDIPVEGAMLRVTTSIGIVYCAGRADRDVLMAAADTALYRAKNAGRNTYDLARI